MAEPSTDKLTTIANANEISSFGNHLVTLILCDRNNVSAPIPKINLPNNKVL